MRALVRNSSSAASFSFAICRSRSFRPGSMHVTCPQMALVCFFSTSISSLQTEFDIAVNRYANYRGRSGPLVQAVARAHTAPLTSRRLRGQFRLAPLFDFIQRPRRTPLPPLCPFQCGHTNPRSVGNVRSQDSQLFQGDLRSDIHHRLRVENTIYPTAIHTSDREHRSGTNPCDCLQKAKKSSARPGGRRAGPGANAEDDNPEV